MPRARGTTHMPTPLPINKRGRVCPADPGAAALEVLEAPEDQEGEQAFPEDLAREAAPAARAARAALPPRTSRLLAAAAAAAAAATEETASATQAATVATGMMTEDKDGVARTLQLAVVL